MPVYIGEDRSVATYPNHKIDYAANGVLWVAHSPVVGSTSQTYFKYSDDGGATWNNVPSMYTTIGAIVTLFIDSNDIMHVTLVQSGSVKYIRGTPTDATRTAYTFSAAVAYINGNYSSSNFGAYVLPDGTTVLVGSYASGSGPYAQVLLVHSVGIDGSLTTRFAQTIHTASYGGGVGIGIAVSTNADQKTLRNGLCHIYWSGSLGTVSSSNYMMCRIRDNGNLTWTREANFTSFPRERTVAPVFDGSRLVHFSRNTSGGALHKTDYDPETLAVLSDIELIASGSAYLFATTSSYTVDPLSRDIVFAGPDAVAGSSNNRHLVSFRYSRTLDDIVDAGGFTTHATTLEQSGPEASLIRKSYNGKAVGTAATDLDALDFYEFATFNTPPGQPGAMAVPALVNGMSNVSWGAASDAEQIAAELKYNIEVSSNGGASWLTAVALTAAGATNSNVDFALFPETANARIRVRAYDGYVYGLWQEYESPFTIRQTPAAPTAITSSPTNTDLPTLGATFAVPDAGGSAAYRALVEWELSTSATFASNVRTVMGDELSSAGVGSKTIYESVPPEQGLTQATWYRRARLHTQQGGVSGWFTDGTIVISHPPSALQVNNRDGKYWNFESPERFTWLFGDTSPIDGQTAYQAQVERNSDGLLLADTAKTVGANGFVDIAINASYKDVLLRWRLRVWDRDDVVGAYSGYQTFYLADAPTVNITSPGNLTEYNSQQLTVNWTFAAGGSRTQKSRRVVVRRVADNVVIHDSGTLVTTATSYTAQTSMVNNVSYNIELTIVDSADLTKVQTVEILAAWDTPAAYPYTMDVSGYDSDGYIEFTWDHSNADDEWRAWRIYRRVIGDTQWELRAEYTLIQGTYEFREHHAESGTEYEFALVELVSRFGANVEGDYSIQPATPVSDNYWVVFSNEEDDWGRAFKTPRVTGDEFTDAHEQEEMHLIGRGRHIDQGDRKGYVGSLTIEVRDLADGTTARQQRKTWERLKLDRDSAYIRTPFGDIFKFVPGDTSFTRLAGVGRRDFGTLTVPYKEVSE